MQQDEHARFPRTREESTMITVQPNDYLSEQAEHSAYAPQFFDENGTGPDCTRCTQDTIVSVLRCTRVFCNEAEFLLYREPSKQLSLPLECFERNEEKPVGEEIVRVGAPRVMVL